MSFQYKLILCFCFGIFVNASSTNDTTIRPEDNNNPVVPNSPELSDPEELPKQEPFTWLLPAFIRNNLPFGSPEEEESEPHPQERRRFDQDIVRRKRPSSKPPRNPEISRRKFEEDIGKVLSRKHPGRVPSLRPRENSYQRYRPKIRLRNPEGSADDNDAQESSVNTFVGDRDNNAHGSLQAALKSLWEYKKKAYRNLLAKSEAFEKLTGKEDESKHWIADSSSSEWPQEFPSEFQADRKSFVDPHLEGVLLHAAESINKFSRGPDILSDNLQRNPPPRRNFEQISDIPQNNPNLRRNPENIQDLPPKIKPSRRIPENPRRIRISNPRRTSDSPDDSPRAPLPKRKPAFERRERFPQESQPHQRETYYPPPRRRTLPPNRESLARHSNIESINYYDDFVDDQSPMSKSESSGRWPRSMQLVRPTDPKPKTDDHKNHVDDDSYFYDLTIIDDEGLGNDAYAYVAAKEGAVINQEKSETLAESINDLTQDQYSDGKVNGGVLTEDYYSVAMDRPVHSVQDIHDFNSNQEIEEIEYVDMYEEDFRKLIHEDSNDYELEEVDVPVNVAVEDQLSYSDFYQRQGSVRIPGSLPPQAKKTIRMKINPGKNSGKKVIKMKIRGLDDSNLETSIGDEKLPQQSLKETPNDNRQFTNKQERPTVSSKKASSQQSLGLQGSKSAKPQGSSGYNYPPPIPPVTVGITPKPKGYPNPSGYGVSNYLPPGKRGKKPNLFDFGKPKPGMKRPGGKPPFFSGFGGIKPGGGSMYAGGGGFNEAGIKNALTSTFHQASGVIPDLSKAITVMSFLAFSLFVANLGVNALANSSLGISLGRESDSPWTLNESTFKIEDMIQNLDKLLEGSEGNSKTAVDSFEAVVDIAENVYNELHDSIQIEVGNLSRKINNYLDNNFSEDGMPLGDISKKYLLIKDGITEEDLNLNCYRRLLCLSHQLTIKHNISDSRNKMLPFWTFGIGWLKGGQERVSTLLENLRSELAGQSGRNCYSLYPDCANPVAVENYVKETELQLKNLVKGEQSEYTKWEPISSSTKKIEEIGSVEENLKIKNNFEEKTEDKFKLVHKATVARINIHKSKK